MFRIQCNLSLLLIFEEQSRHIVCHMQAQCLSSKDIVQDIPRMSSTVWVSRQYETNINPFASSCWYFPENSFLLFLSLNILPTASYLLVNTIIVWVQLLAFQTRFMRPMITHMMITLLYCPTETQVVFPLWPNILCNYRHRNVSPNLKSLTSDKLSSPRRLGRPKQPNVKS